MQSGARAVALVVLLLLFAASAFAGDADKPATNPPDNTTNAAAPSDPPQASPSPAPAQKKSASSDPSRSEYTPAGELFLGYSYVRLSTNAAVVPGGPTQNQHFDMIPGGVAQASGNINNWFGLAGDFGIYSLHDVGHVNAMFYTYLFGPRFTYRTHFATLFANALGGGARISSTLSGTADTTFFNHSFHSNAAAAAVGAGVDLNTATKYLAIRLAEAEYLLTTFSDNHNDRQNNFRISGGFVVRFGFPSAPPPPKVHHPPTPATCTADPSSIQEGSGQSVAVRADTTSPDGNPLTYTWSATGGAVDGTGPQVHWNPGTAGTGTYTVTARVDDGAGGTTSCSTDITIAPRPHRPPTITCAASPASLRAGEKSTVTAKVTNPDNDPLTYSWKASGGTVTGTGDTVTFDSTGLRAGHYTVNCHVSSVGGAADGSADIEVQPPRELETRLALHSVFFPTAQPTVKDPTGGLLPSQKQTLTQLAEDFKKYLTFKPDAYLTLRGHTDPRGSAQYNQALSDRRVGSVKNFLVERGVAADVIKTEGLGEETPMTEAEVKRNIVENPETSAEVKTRLVKELKAVTLALSRRVDVVLNNGQASTAVYPFNASDLDIMLNPNAYKPKTPRAPVKKAPARRAPATKKK
jgi:outer membrane protein OmpA-like peptidoglycan-associated protein